jgi:hypothetical protein
VSKSKFDFLKDPSTANRIAAISTLIAAVALVVSGCFSWQGDSISNSAYQLSSKTASDELQTALLERLAAYPALSVRCATSLRGRQPDYKFAFDGKNFSPVDGGDSPDSDACTISNDGKLPALDVQINLVIRSQPPPQTLKTPQEYHDLRPRYAEGALGRGVSILIPRVGASERLIFQLMHFSTAGITTIGVLRACQYELPELPQTDPAEPVSTPTSIPCHLPRNDDSAPANEVQREFVL